MKQCSLCKEIKVESDYYFVSGSRSKLRSQCRQCSNRANAEYYKLNRVERRRKGDEYYEANKEKLLKKQAEYAKANLDKMKAKYERHYAANKPSYLHRYKLRQCRKLKATPAWLSKAQLEEIRTIYNNRPDGYHVDHIVPLQGKNVCGLHVPWNLQYLPAKENLAKFNKY